MAAHTTRQATSLLSLSSASRGQAVFALRRCIHQSILRHEQQQQQNVSESFPHEKFAEENHLRRPEDAKHVRRIPRAPFSVRERQPFAVNDSLEMLHAMYDSLLGGEYPLSDDIKWQAVTHKSFDHGRQPYNQKLSYFGKTILQMQAAIHVLSKPPKAKVPKPSVYMSLEGLRYENPKPFEHNDYKNLQGVSRGSVDDYCEEDHLSPLIKECGLEKVMRWKPAENGDLTRSGYMSVASECLFAIVGAIALQRGGEAAERFVNEKILRRNKTVTAL